MTVYFYPEAYGNKFLSEYMNVGALTECNSGVSPLIRAPLIRGALIRTLSSVPSVSSPPQFPNPIFKLPSLLPSVPHPNIYIHHPLPSSPQVPQPNISLPPLPPPQFPDLIFTSTATPSMPPSTTKVWCGSWTLHTVY